MPLTEQRRNEIAFLLDMADLIPTGTVHGCGGGIIDAAKRIFKAKPVLKDVEDNAKTTAKWVAEELKLKSVLRETPTSDELLDYIHLLAFAARLFNPEK